MLNLIIDLQLLNCFGESGAIQTRIETSSWYSLTILKVMSLFGFPILKLNIWWTTKTEPNETSVGGCLIKFVKVIIGDAKS